MAALFCFRTGKPDHVVHRPDRPAEGSRPAGAASRRQPGQARRCARAVPRHQRPVYRTAQADGRLGQGGTPRRRQSRQPGQGRTHRDARPSARGARARRCRPATRHRLHRAGPPPSGHTSASPVHHQYSGSVSPFQANTGIPRGFSGVPPLAGRPTATAAAA